MQVRGQAHQLYDHGKDDQRKYHPCREPKTPESRCHERGGCQLQREASCNGEAQRVLNIDTVENIRVDCQAATAGKPMGSMLHCRQDNESFSEENGTRMTMWRDWLSKS
ncbi:hypothetical protein SCLCIDRAFT_734377 [Scleroderma citrinum Foug A]|uniref:Uncharacterized protein n=1 Tax=Scleroderma citrinum Foug A TaxID=1036808 RepID=A0A0C3E6M6_9AGAM|nr:hypothetical protein SCLCIDRAFT_734377 [Scleroderma citrinum Foug A]